MRDTPIARLLMIKVSTHVPKPPSSTCLPSDEHEYQKQCPNDSRHSEYRAPKEADTSPTTTCSERMSDHDDIDLLG